MQGPKNFKETYLKLVIIIALFFFSTGLILIIKFPDGVFFSIGLAFIQLGITLFIVDLFISHFASRLFRIEIIKNFREVLGINNPESSLFPELIRLIRPHPYNVLDFSSENTFVYDEKNRKKPVNMRIVEKTKILIQALEDNIQYNFYRVNDPGVISTKYLKEIKKLELQLFIVF